MRGARQVAVLVRAGRRSLPKALLGGGESLEAAAERAAREWVGAPSGAAAARGDSLGVALVVVPFRAAGGAYERTLAVWFHRFELVGEPEAPRASEASEARELGGWALEWLAPRAAALELAQVEERRLVERVLVRPEEWRAALARELAPRDRRERWLYVALAGTALLGPAAVTLGWFEDTAWSPTWVPRAALAAFLGGLTGAASRVTATAASPLLGALAGAAVGTLVALGGALGLGVTAPASLVVAWLGGLLERVRLRTAAPPTSSEPG